MRFGEQTVTFVAVTETGPIGQFGLRTKQRTETPVEGCQFWSMDTAETPDGQTNVSIDVWRCIAPPEALVLVAASTGELIYDGKTYQIQGPIQPRRNRNGVLHHVTITCKRQAG